jgi:hypothetical protein
MSKPPRVEAMKARPRRGAASAHGEIARLAGDVEPLEPNGVELPAGLRLGEGAHLREAIVGDVHREAEGEGKAEDAARGADASDEAAGGVDVVVATVGLSEGEV